MSQTAHEGLFYVTAMTESGHRKWFAAGPYATHAEALAAVESVRRECCEADGRGDFLAWGTARYYGPPKDAPRVLLDTLRGGAKVPSESNR
jgi:hypothetical protein